MERVETMNLKEWLRSEGFLDHQQQQHASGPTHVFMDGGKAFVPADREAMFLNAYSACVLQRERLYVVERATAPTFRLFADLDFKAPEGAQWRDALDAAVRMVAGEAFRFFAVPDPSYATVCEAQPRRGAGGINKHGVHVVWQNIYATASTALAFRAALLRRLVSEVADHPFVNSWTDIVDASVYKSGGLRMIFSRKVTKCRCGGEDAACASCHGHGAYSDPLVYTPAYRYHAATGAVERIDDCTASMRKLVADCSIRSHGRAPSALGIPDPGAAAAAAAAAPQRRGGGRRRRLNDGDDDDEADDEAGILRLEGSGLEPLPLHEYLDELETLKGVLPLCYRSCKFTSLKRTPNGGGKKAADPRIVASTNSHNCLNLEGHGAHNRNHVYFVITPTHMYQKCFCTCSTVHRRIKGRCRDFKSRAFPVPPAVSRALFGKVALLSVRDDNTRAVGPALNGRRSSWRHELKLG